MKSVIRSIKNEINNYDEGERLVRELTSNERSPPSTQMLIKLKIMLTDQYQFPTVVRMLFKRLKDYNNIRHVEKGLICIEYLIKNADRKFVRYCCRDKVSISKLTRYRYILGNNDGVPVDYGGNIRKRAKRITDLLSNSEKLQIARAKAQGYAMKFNKSPKKKQKKPQKKQKKISPKNIKNSKSKSAPQSHKTKKVKKKLKKERKTVAKQPILFESFIDMPPPQDTNSNEINNNKKKEINNDMDIWGDEFAWFEADATDKYESGVGDDGGAFNFANEEEKDAEDVYEDDEEVDADAWMTCMTQMDNVLDGNLNIQKKDQNKKKQGVSMAQMAKSNPIKQTVQSSFGTDDFFKQNANANVKKNKDEFDPFGLENNNNNKNDNIMNMYGDNTKKNYNFGADPFAGIGGGGGAIGGPISAKYVPRKKQSDPFAQFGAMK